MELQPGLFSSFLRLPRQRQVELQIRGWFSRRTGPGAGDGSANSAGRRVEAERRNAGEAPGDDRHLLAQDFQLQFLSGEGRRKVSRRSHRTDQVLQSLMAHNSNVFHLIALFDEAESLLNFPPRKTNPHNPP